MALSDGLLTDDQRQLVDGIAAVSERFLTEDYLSRMDRESRYPSEIMDALAAGGWAGFPVSDEGVAASAADLAVVHEALARHSLTIGQTFFSMWVLGAEAFNRLGTEQQRKEWLPRISEGARVAFALTEPGSGSDAAALSASARLEDGSWVVSGQKVFITGAAVADIIVTAVRTASRERRQDGISLLLVNPNAPGVEVRKLSKMGIRGLDLCEVFFDRAEVPAGDVLGTVDGAWRELSPGLARERLCLAALSVGALSHVLELCVQHATDRTTFGRPIGGHQLIADKLVEMRLGLEASRGLVRRAAALVDAGHADAPAMASLAKLAATSAYVSATREGVQVFGGYGFTDEYPISRHYRDCKYLEIGGGSSEIQKIIVARSMGLSV